MKTHEQLYRVICSFENLHLAYRSARKGKRGKAPVAAFEYDQEKELLQLRDELRDGSYRPGPYHSFYIHEPKRRLISAAPFRDRVVHHALCQVIEPIWERRFIYDTYANRKDKGTHCALDRCQEFSRRYRFVLQCDLRQFFPSIDHAILQRTLARYIGDEDVQGLCDLILRSGVGVLSEAYEMVWFPGDDLLATLRPHGLPIGNLTSQFWANVYLNEFDHFVKRELGCRAYLRYVDDFLLFGDDRQQLHGWRRAMMEILAGLRLTLHENRSQVYPVRTGIPFLGFRVYASHRRLKRHNGIAFQRRFRRMLRDFAEGRLDGDRLTASIRGWEAHTAHGQTVGLRRAVLGSRANLTS